MTDRGTFAITRQLFDHPVFRSEPYTEREAWVWMIGEAVWRPTKVRVNRAQFELKRGQFAHALRFLAGKWQWSEPRVRRFCERLKNEAMIDALATPDATVITICNYDQYQFGGGGSEEPSDEPATNRRRREEEPQDSDGGEGGVARAREPAAFKISEAAMAFATELAAIAGHDPEFLPPQWVSAGPAMRVQMMLDAGWLVDVMRVAAKAVMGRKRDGPPVTIRYFEPIFSRAHAPQLPLKTAPTETSHAKAASPDGDGNIADRGPGRSGGEGPGPDWRSSRDAFRRAHAKLRAHNEQQSGEPGSGESGGQVVQLASATRRA